MHRNTSSRLPRAVLITACSSVFYDHYVDMLDSLGQIGLDRQFDIGVLDMGLTDVQIRALETRGVICVAGTWPIQPPAGHDRPEYVAFAAKPYARNYFPGYDVYVWMDADMWAQTPAFWHDLIDGAMQHGAAVPEEAHPAYATMPFKEKFWMLRHLSALVGLRTAVKLAKLPMVNNGLFALHANAPHWANWQRRFTDLVQRSGRMIAIDQLAMMASVHLDEPQVALLPATNNWVCSLATPDWDPVRKLFVTPDRGDPISVMHITTPSRTREYQVRTIGSTVSPRYLHRPGGRVMASLLGAPDAVLGMTPQPAPPTIPVARPSGVPGAAKTAAQPRAIRQPDHLSADQ